MPFRFVPGQCCCGGNPAGCTIHSTVPGDNLPWREMFLASGTMPTVNPGGSIQFNAPGSIFFYHKPYWLIGEGPVPFGDFYARDDKYYSIGLNDKWIHCHASLHGQSARISMITAKSKHHTYTYSFYNSQQYLVKYRCLYYEQYVRNSLVESQDNYAWSGLDPDGQTLFHYRGVGLWDKWTAGYSVVFDSAAAIVEGLPDDQGQVNYPTGRGIAIQPRDPLYVASEEARSFPSYESSIDSGFTPGHSFERRPLGGSPTRTTVGLKQDGKVTVVEAGEWCYFSSINLGDPVLWRFNVLEPIWSVFETDMDTAFSGGDVAVINSNTILYSTTDDKLRKIVGNTASAESVKTIPSISGITRASSSSIVFIGKDPITIVKQVWVSNGTTIDTDPATAFIAWPDPVRYGDLRRAGSIVFISKNGGDTGSQLLKSDGTVAGTSVAHTFGLGVPDITKITPIHATDPNVAFLATPPGGTESIYTRIGSTTSLLYDVQSSSPGSTIIEMAFAGGMLYFTKDLDGSGTELFAVNLVGGIPFLVKEFYPASEEEVTELQAAGSLMFFIASTIDGKRVFATDSTFLGTRQVMDMPGSLNHKMVGTAHGKAFFLVKLDWHDHEILFSSEGDPINTWIHIIRDNPTLPENVAVGQHTNDRYTSIIADEVWGTHHAIDPRLRFEIEVTGPVQEDGAPLVVIDHLKLRPSFPDGDCEPISSRIIEEFRGMGGPATITVQGGFPFDADMPVHILSSNIPAPLVGILPPGRLRYAWHSPNTIPFPDPSDEQRVLADMNFVPPYVAVKVPEADTNAELDIPITPWPPALDPDTEPLTLWGSTAMTMDPQKTYGLFTSSGIEKHAIFVNPTIWIDHIALIYAEHWLWSDATFPYDDPQWEVDITVDETQKITQVGEW